MSSQAKVADKTNVSVRQKNLGTPNLDPVVRQQSSLVGPNFPIGHGNEPA
jgi:hypothetical protein